MAREFEVKIELKNRLLPALVVLLALLQLIAPYRGLMMLLVGLGGAWLIAYLWALSLAGGLRIQRERRFGWARVGDQLVERFTLSNDGWAPAVWAEMDDQSTLPVYGASRVANVGSYRSIRWHSKATCTLRGLFMLGPTSLRSGDPFALYRVTIHYPASAPLLVLPPIVPLPSIEVAPGGRSGEGRPRTNAPDRTVSAASVREYAPGDSLRWVHWPTSARRGSLYVRLFDGTPAGDWWILLDLDQRVQVGEGEDSTEEHGVILAASLADRGLRSRRAVGLVAQGEDLAWLPPRAGDAQRLEILRALAIASPGERSLAQLLARVGSSLGQHDSLVIITAALSEDWIEALAPLLRRGCMPTVLLLDPTSFLEPGARRSPAMGDVREVVARLDDLKIARYVITKDLLGGADIELGQQGRWEWRVLGTGHVAPVRQPHDMTWRELA
ncbi:MAG TPA: DUF58 domain-containing protein [Chloroflexi bacterium]|nr:DUF58 domain-containing protein [Chloroflexota bacterium]